MKKDKIIEYFFIICLCCVLFFNLFVLNVFNNKYVFSIFLLLYWVICNKFVKGRKISNQNKKNVILLVTVFALIYVILLYIIGIFAGFYKNPVGFSIKNLYRRIIPITAIIIFSELIRAIIVTKNNKKPTILITIALVLVDICLDIQLYSSFRLEEILSLVGYVCMSSISINLLCNYMVKRYGTIPCILYRIIITMYAYIFPILPDIYAFFETVYRIIYPYLIYIIIDFTFSKNNFKFALKDKQINLISLIIGIIFSLGLVMLVSCKFKYGIMVVGSYSMSGCFEKGDAVIFEQYKEQELQEGDVIIFNKEGIRTIHRIDDKQKYNNETIFYTKGDNNQQRDKGYITSQDITGIVRKKVLYIGWPTVWLNEVFTKES